MEPGTAVQGVHPSLLWWDRKVGAVSVYPALLEPAKCLVEIYRRWRPGARGGGRGGAGSMIEVKAKVCFLDTVYITSK